MGSIFTLIPSGIYCPRMYRIRSITYYVTNNILTSAYICIVISQKEDKHCLQILANRLNALMATTSLLPLINTWKKWDNCQQIWCTGLS